MNEPPSHPFTAALAATYDIHRELGGGGMSRVFLATDRALGRQVVIKTLPADILSPDAVERFQREIRTAASLQHPNIVPLLTAGEVEGVPYFTMPWVEGASLRERMQRGRVPVDEACDILRDMARALAAAHAKGIVHRDIKPENVLLSSGAALITDFGVARALTAATGAFQTATGISVGTPSYMSPEQFAADPAIDHRADIYAWGIVAYELLTGHHPFAGATGTALLQAHLSSVPEPITVRGVSPDLSRTVARALEKDPAQRIGDAETLAHAVTAALTPAPGARAPGTTPPLRGRRLAIGITGVLALAAALAFAMSRRGAQLPGDERMIAIAPFRVGGAAASVHYLREGLGDLMTPQLQSIPGVSSPSMRVMLEQWRRAAGSPATDLPDDQALRVAAAAGAGQLILGQIVGTPTGLTVDAKLLRVRDGASLATAHVEGPADSAAALAARIVATVLSIRDGGTVERVRNVVSASPAAITPFLVGEQAYRRGRYTEAGKAFAAAFAADTTFALAALRTSTMNGWAFGEGVPGPWLDRAWRHRDRLRGLDSLLLTSVAGSEYPKPTSISRYHQELRQAAELGNTAELWHSWADAVYHRGSHTGDTLADRHALEGFMRAEALDSLFAPALEHQPAIYSTLGDTAKQRAAWKRQRMVDSTGDFYSLNESLVAAQLGTPEEAIEAFREYVKREPVANVFSVVILSSDYPMTIADERRLSISDAFLRIIGDKPRPVPRDPNIVLGVAGIHLNTGRPRPIRVAPGPDSALFESALNALAALVWDGDSATGAQAVQTLERLAPAVKDTAYTLARSTSFLTYGLWSLHRGDTAGAERARMMLRTLRAPTAQPWLAITPAIHEKLLAAHLSVARKASDARPRLLELDSLLMDTPANRNLVLSLGNLLVSGLWEKLGDDQRAWRAIDRKHSHIGANAFASARLRARARIAERLGRRDDAIATLRTFTALRAKAFPRFQREVAQGRETLARLERTPSGK